MKIRWLLSLLYHPVSLYLLLLDDICLLRYELEIFNFFLYCDLSAEHYNLRGDYYA